MPLTLPYPALFATHGGIWIASPEGEVRGIGRGEAAARAAETPMIVLNAAVTATRLGIGEFSGLDLLELSDIIIYHEMSEGVMEQIVGRGRRVNRALPLRVHRLWV